MVCKHNMACGVVLKSGDARLRDGVGSITYNISILWHFSTFYVH